MAYTIRMVPPTCPECPELIAKMRMAFTEAEAIIHEADAVIQGSKTSEHAGEWWQIKQRWEKAHRDWVVAAANLKNHLATPPGQGVSPSLNAQMS